MRDDQLYAIVHTPPNWMPYKVLHDDFISSFNLGPAKDCLYIIEVEHLIAPLAVFPDIGGPLTKFFAMLPCRHWPRHFSDFIESLSDEEYSVETK
jgi:hypothetical protein